MGSTRFPGKPMKYIMGMPMVGHVYHRCKMNKRVSEVYVATCDKEIFDYVTSIGGKAIMTLDTHERCTERTSEALLTIEALTKKRVDIVVMVQGDEPMTTPEMIDEAITPMIKDETIGVVNLTAPIKTSEEFNSPNSIKVVLDKDSNALYFSRMPIPFLKRPSLEDHCWKQVCIIPFKRDDLIEFNNLPPTKLEILESVDMLRLLENGKKVKMIPTAFSTQAVDHPEDLINVEKILKDDPTTLKYI